jgi:hypothetical protein
MSRAAVPLLMLAVLSGCLSVDEFGYEPTAYRSARYNPVRTTWAKPDGAPAEPEPVLPPTPVKAPMETALSRAPSPSKAPAEPQATKTPQTQSRDEAMDGPLVKATWTEAPRTTSRPDTKADTVSVPRDLTTFPLPRIITGKAAAELNPSPAASAAVACGPIGSSLRLVNSKRIAFHFEIKDPTATPCVVEVWGTQDLKSWKKYEPLTHKSKTVVEVKDEGLYGFTLLARGAGSVSKAPQQGEVPQVWVAVDCTRPAVQFVGAELNILSKTPTLVVRWIATDKNFGPRPVTLYYADHAEGPWTLLVGNVENTGRYEWPLPTNLPSALHLRVQAVDLMGNVGMAQTPNLLQHLRSSSVVTQLSGEPAPFPAVREPEKLVLQQGLAPLPATPSYEVLRVPVPAAIPEPARVQLSVTGVEGEHE